MFKKVFIILMVLLWSFVLVYFIGLKGFEDRLDQIKKFYEMRARDLAKNVSVGYFQWRVMYECALNNREEELQFWFEDLKNNYTEVEEIKILELNNVDFELFKIDSSGVKLHFLMRICDDTVSTCLSDRVALLVVNAQALLENIGVDEIRISEKGEDFCFGLKYERIKPIMNLTSYFVTILGALVAALVSILLEIKTKMKYLIKEANLKRVQKAILEIVEKYLVGTKVEEMYQFLLEKAIESIPNAQGGSVLVRRENRFVYVATVGYDLKELSKVSFPLRDVMLWASREGSIKRRSDVISYNRELDDQTFALLKKAGRLNEIMCNVNFGVEVQGEMIAQINLDNFESEDAFDEETIELVSLFASHLGVLFERAKLEQEIEEQKRLMEYLSNHDPLTGLANRRLFEDMGNKLLSLAARQGKSVSVMFMDLANFKHVNDIFGHNFGDEVLRLIGARLEKVVRQGDLVARFGGDEFVLVIYDCNEECAQKLAERIIEVVEEPLKVDEQSMRISAHIGVASYPKDGEDLNHLVRLADVAMYNAKRNNVRVFFSDKM